MGLWGGLWGGPIASTLPMGLWSGLWGGPIVSILPYGSLERSVGWPYSLYPSLWVFGVSYGAVLYTVAHSMGLRGPSVGWPYSVYPPYRSLRWSVGWPYSLYPPYGSLRSPMGLIRGDLIFSIPPYRFWGS